MCMYVTVNQFAAKGKVKLSNLFYRLSFTVITGEGKQKGNVTVFNFVGIK